MNRLFIIDRDGREHCVEGICGEPLMHTLRNLDYGVEAICGGMCACATCHVYVAEEWLARVAAAASDEEQLLDEVDNRLPNSRLSCQLFFSEALSGLKVTLAP